MNWGNELWDQYENLSAYTLKGIEFLEKYSQFIKDRCAIESDYAGKLKKLAKSYNKKITEDELQFSTSRAFSQTVNEINDMAVKHETLAETLITCVVKEIGVLAKELRDERKNHLQEGSKLQMNIQASLNHLEKSKKCYEKSFKESEKANENYQKALADLHLSRIELEKARVNSITKLRFYDEFKVEYENQLQKTNEAQNQHYFELMPKVFKSLQITDEKRILAFQSFMKRTSDAQRQGLPTINKCLDEIDKAADSITPKLDSEVIIGRLKTGNEPPGDISFEPLTLSKVTDTAVSPSLLHGKSDTCKGTFSTQKAKKRGGLFSIFSANSKVSGDSKDDYSDLPPNQRRKRLTQRVESISSQIFQENSAREALLKLKATYEQNAALGDPVSVEPQLLESCSKIQQLETQLHKYQAFLAEIDGKTHLDSAADIKNETCTLEDDVCRSSSNSSVNNTNKSAAPAIPLPRENTSKFNDNNASDSRTAESNNGEMTEYEVEPLPALGTANALYPFDAQSEGSIPMQDGEEFEVVELDQGDGWTRVRRANMEEGFVPTSYIECHLYNC